MASTIFGPEVVLSIEAWTARHNVVVDKRFCWGHMPKTGGDMTRSLFWMFRDVGLEIDEQTDNRKHDLFSDRNMSLTGKLLVLNLRRLPCWLLSRAQHQARYGQFPLYTPIPMPRASELSRTCHADEMLRAYAGDSPLNTVNVWFRLEFLKRDFIEFMTSLGYMNEERRVSVLQSPSVNCGEFDHHLRAWFSPADMEEIYRNNPLWASLEAALYPTPRIVL